jgi:hypothetical protein
VKSLDGGLSKNRQLFYRCGYETACDIPRWRQGQ